MKPTKRPKKKRPLTAEQMGKLGGKARARALSKEQRQASARKAVQARWAAAKAKPPDEAS